MRVHELKTWPEFFQAVLDGNKGHEIRINDRDFAVGDVLHLREWDPASQYRSPESPPIGYTGRFCKVRVMYMTYGGSWGLPGNVCVMSIDLVDSGPACTSMSPPWFTGRWRDWHRGHGCDKDDGKPMSPEARAEIHQRALQNGMPPSGRKA